MEWPTIPKPRSALGPAWNLTDYDAQCSTFSWDAVRSELAGVGGSINIADVGVERQLRRGLGDKPALIWLAKDKSRHLITYGDLSRTSSRFASALEGLGIGHGDVVFSLLGRVPELYATALGTWKRGAIFCPLFSAFGPEPVCARMEIANAKVLVTTERLYRRKVAPIRDRLPSLEHVILVGGGEGGHDFDALIAEGDETYPPVASNPQDLATLHFTSGTTGKP